MQANQHLLLQLWILAKRIGSILISGYNLNMAFHVSCGDSGQATGRWALQLEGRGACKRKLVHWHSESPSQAARRVPVTSESARLRVRIPETMSRGPERLCRPGEGMVTVCAPSGTLAPRYRLSNIRYRA
jgi:hypothetical protein